jgi:hypothetical protein
MAMTYIQAIGIGFPAVQCHALGDGSVYSDLVWDAGSPIPDQATLDAWIGANPDVTVNNTIITKLAFRNRFTQTEKVTIDLASIDNPTAPAATRQLSAALRVMAADMSNASNVNLARPDTIAGVQALETYGLIGPGRANTILTAPIQPEEVPAA